MKVWCRHVGAEGGTAMNASDRWISWRRRVALTSGAVALAALLPGTAATAAPSAPAPAAVRAAARAAAPDRAPAVRYAAIGDSFAAGVGTGRDDLAGPPCERSSLAYPALWARAHAGTALTFVACSGARIAATRKEQVARIPADADLVTVTVGGNDAGFAPVLTVCRFVRSDRTCRLAVSAAELVVATEMTAQLTVTLLDVHRRAPHARVVVLGYPRLFGDGPCPAHVPNAARRSAIDAGTDLLDAVLAQTATSLGARFVDVRDRFARHGVCAAPGQSWINGPDAGAGSYHPTVAGHASGYLPALTAAIG
jgi:lysophospholipase L1-like esterase